MQVPASKLRVVRFGVFEVDLQEAELRKSGIHIKLQEQPFQILTMLLEHPGQTVTREELRSKLWPTDTFVDFDHSLNSSINKLREALGDSSEVPRFIETLHRRGYRFIAPVCRSPAPVKEPEQPVPVVETPVTHARWPFESPRATSLQRIVAASVIALVLFGVAIYWATSPPPMPRIVSSHVLTNTGYSKSWSSPIVDRGSLYFLEKRPSGWVYQQISAAGGEESSVLKPNVFLRDISRDGSKMLWSVVTDETTGKADTWMQPLPTGSPRLIMKDATSSIWNAEGDGIFFTRNNWTELYRANSDGTGMERLATVPHIGNPHLSPDGSRIRFTGPFPDFALWEVGVDGSNPRPILSGSQDVWGGTWSSDGKYFFFTAWDGDRSSLWAISEGRHWWWKTNTSLPQQLTFGPMSIESPAISKDGKQLFAVGIERRGELAAYDSKSGKFVPYLGGESICMVDFSRVGQWVAYVTYPEGTLWRSRIDGSERRQLTVPPMAVDNPRWSPDGKLIAFSDPSNGNRRTMTYFGPRRTYVISVDGGAPVQLLEGYFSDPVWSLDGGSIAYGCHRTRKREVRILDLQSKKSTTVPGSQGMWSPRWSPDGKYVVALGGPNGSDKLMLFSFASNAWVGLASSVSRGFDWPSWSHDSKFVYAEDGDLVVRIAIADHKKEQIALLTFPTTGYYVDRIGANWVGLTPDGRPITTRDTGIAELYAFDLDYK